MERPVPRHRAALLARRRGHRAPTSRSRLAGSTDLFGHRGRRPWASVNFVTAHDGFTLHDLVSYDDKHNEANGEDNRDGHDDNYSAGTAASRGRPTIPRSLALRDRQKRNFMATLLLSQGMPMLLAGDEIGRTPAAATTTPIARTTRSPGSTGSNDPPENERSSREFVRHLIALRRATASSRGRASSAAKRCRRAGSRTSPG